MADTVADKKETVAVAEKEVCEKPVVSKDDVVSATDEDSKQSENGDAKLKENGDKDEKEEEVKETENGDATEKHETCPIKRKSGGGDAPEGVPTEGASPEKKAKLDDKQPAADATESNGSEAKAAA